MGERLFVGTRKGLFRLERGTGGRWTVAATEFVGDPVSVVLPDSRDNHVYAALGHGHFGVKLHRSPDGGRTWEECAAPEYPPPPEGVDPILCPMRGTPIPWSTELVWGLEAGGLDEPGVLWCGTIPGGLFRSTDRGSTWDLIRPLWDGDHRRDWFGGGMDYPGVHSICVDPRDSRRVHVGISCGGVWGTTDGGKNWSCRAKGMFAEYMPPEKRFDPNIQDPHRLVQCPAAPDVFWVQHHNGVFRSTDGSESWHGVPNVPPSTFGFAVAVHPHKPDTAWLIPALSDQRRVPIEGRVVVARTQDGGKNFNVLTRGLPQEHAYDIVFRHALDVDQSGDALAFGSTTGSLWSSEDGGDSWDTVSNHLPPVYAVRFG